MFLEVIATSLDDIKILNNKNSRVQQIELCANMAFGGYTPPYDLIKQATMISHIPIMVMVRHSNNGFDISTAEFAQMKADIAFIKTTKAAGIVCGLLTKDNNIDIERMTEIVKLATPLRITFHRAFDEVSNPQLALTQLKTLGISTILTSGGKNAVASNIATLQQWQKWAAPITILVGGGVNHLNLPLLLKAGLNNIHVGKIIRINSNYDQPLANELINIFINGVK